MADKPLTIGLIGATIWGNRGAEAMLVTAIGQVRRAFPAAQFIVFSYSPAQDRALITDPAVRVVNSRPAALVLRHFLGALLLRVGLPGPAAAQALRGCDALLDVSGISFAGGREKTLPFNILNMWPALILGVPVVRLSQAMGPFDHPLNRLSARLFLARSTRIFARGQQTADFLQALALPAERWQPAADVAFLYEPEFSLSRENEERVAAQTAELDAALAADRTVIGLSPSSLVYQKSMAEGQDYLGTFARLINELPASTQFVVLPNATRAGRDTPYNNDLYAIDLLRERVAALCGPAALERVTWVDYDLNTAGSRALLERCALVLTSRFHAMISSLCLQKPVIVVGWSHKYAEVMAEFGLERFVADYAKEGLDLAALVEGVLADPGPILAQLAENLPRVQAASRRQFEAVESLLK